MLRPSKVGSTKVPPRTWSKGTFLFLSLQIFFHLFIYLIQIRFSLIALGFCYRVVLVMCTRYKVEFINNLKL